MSAKGCNCCGANVDVQNGGAALQLAFCHGSTTTLTNVAFCADCYKALIDEDIRRLNVNGNLGIVFEGEA
jgi:hypothetical protein